MASRIITWTPIMISAIAVILAGLGYLESRKSNKIANNALSASQQSFEVGSRPYLSLRAARFKETQKFIQLEARKGQLEIRFRFELNNNGQLPAREIRLPTGLSITGRAEQIRDLERLEYIKSLKNVALAPEERIFVSISVTLKDLTDEEIAANFQKFESDTLSFPISMPVYYKSSQDSAIEYRTLVHVTISPSSVSIHETKLE